MKIYVDELPKSCNDCKFQVFVAHYEQGWQHHERYCSIMKENYDCKCSKENCPIKPIAEHDKQVRKEVCDEIRKEFFRNCIGAGETEEEQIYYITRTGLKKLLGE